MANFKYYNIQALPLAKTEKMIGSAGYKSIFKSLKALVDKNIKDKNVQGISHNLRNDFFIAPVKIDIQDDIAFGEFMKFDVVTTVFGTLDDDEKYVSDGGDSSKKYAYRFVFDFKKHILAIEKSRGLPTVNVLEEVLFETLDGHRQNLFPNHSLKIIEMTNSETLNNVIDEAASYKRVDVEVTFSNSEDWCNGLADEILKAREEEMRNKSIDSIHHVEKSAKDSTMTEPSQAAISYLGLACKFGNAAITYKNDAGKTKTYKMTDFPITLSVQEAVKGKVKTALDFAYDIKNSIKTANELAKDAKKLLTRLRKGVIDEKEDK